MSTVNNTEYASALEHVANLLKAHVPYIWVTTHEEGRFMKCLYAEVINKQNQEMWTWSCYQGLMPYDIEEKQVRATGDMDKTWMPNVALEKIVATEVKKDKKGSVWVLKDFHSVLSQTIPRQLRDMRRSLMASGKTIIILSPFLANGGKPGIEPTLDKEIVVVNYELPDKDAVEKHVRTVVAKMQKKSEGKKDLKTKVDYTEEEFQKFTTALQGLTELEISVALGTSITHLQRIDEHKLLQEKKQIVQRSDILEYIGHTPSMDDVGGLDAAKQYFATYSNQFTKEAADYGVDPLRGVLLTGVPGTGKSLLAKAISATWNLPLLRLDVGKVMTGLVGGSEEKMRQVIGQVEAIAPAVLWIDEIEKSLSGTKSSNFSDGGTLSRVFGTLLTAMEERMQGVVTIATANDIQALPPELIRRFNEVLFVDLPVDSEREEIFKIHLRKRKRDITKLELDMSELVKLTHLYTGSEIEKAVKEGIARAFHKSRKDVTQEDLVGAIKDTKCIAKVMKDQIDAIRDWARDKARYASSLALAASAPGAQKVRLGSGKELDIGKDLDDLDEVGNKKVSAISDNPQFDQILND